ncbi:UvrB/UvrC motif-containing protein [Bacillus sp. EAC]|uniref:UvrB/UvrC motif-containing protein n=1 Tax=Bacillus sp. EAC TaxID=1978338 RepID=UPI000B4406C1|nr:UvrB/UvrC motif-containing protein [Bacillus sp. EAC]
MKDSKGHILYVGKAKSLKKRVQSYFRDSSNHSPKVKKLVTHLKDFDTILTDTEFDAFMLECHLIKEIKPHYNRMMKSPMSFVYLVINMDKKIRSFEISYQPSENEHNLIFGPFTSRGIVERAINGMKDCFKINCAHSTVKNSACLNYSLGLCNGLCLGGPAVDEYNAIIDKMNRFLHRTDTSLLEEMEKMMYSASEEFDFEAAAKYRDWIEAVKSLLNKEKVIEFTEENHNILIVEKLDDEGMIKLFLINRTQVLFTGKYHFQNQSIEQLCEVFKSIILSNFSKIIMNSTYDVSQDEIDEAQIIYSYLNSTNCNSLLIPSDWLNASGTKKLDRELFNFLNSLN